MTSSLTDLRHGTCKYILDNLQESIKAIHADFQAQSFLADSASLSPIKTSGLNSAQFDLSSPIYKTPVEGSITFNFAPSLTSPTAPKEFFGQSLNHLEYAQQNQGKMAFKQTERYNKIVSEGV